MLLTVAEKLFGFVTKPSKDSMGSSQISTGNSKKSPPKGLKIFVKSFVKNF